jgi:L-lactate dehydrogenase (cytochrome)
VADSRLASILSLDDFERAARRHLPRPVFGYVAGAVEDNRSYRDNREAFDDYRCVPRVLIDISRRSTQTSLFGQTHSVPFGIAPMGIEALYAYRGDLVLARAAARARLPMIMSGSSLIRLEEVAADSPGTWFQAYLPGDQAQIDALIARVAAAGFQTLVITVDTPVSANRENNVRTGFSTPLRPSLRLAWDGISHPRWLFGTFLRTIVQHGMPHVENNYAPRGAPILSSSVARDFAARGHLNWTHFARIRALWKGRLIIKGVLAADDARLACDHGAQGVIVSNHGGRQLDAAPSTVKVLPGIRAAVGPQVPIIVDSGARNGLDIARMLALGADFVIMGRAFHFAVAALDKQGGDHVMKVLKSELRCAMGQIGCATLKDLPRFLVS